MFALLLSHKNLPAQKVIHRYDQIWLGYFNQARFSDRWGTWADLQCFTKQEFFSNLFENVISAGATYYITNDVKFTAAYSFAHLYPTDNLAQPEHRPWQQIMWHSNHQRLRLIQWFRLDERFRRKVDGDKLDDGYNFNYRARYNFSLSVALGKEPFAPNTLSFAMGNELFINFGKQITYNYFDQDRFFAGFNFHTTNHDILQFGYLYVFQQLAAGNEYRSINAGRVFYFHNLDLRKKRN